VEAATAEEVATEPTPEATDEASTDETPKAE
jgi:hypothetical protein